MLNVINFVVVLLIIVSCVEFVTSQQVMQLAVPGLKFKNNANESTGNKDDRKPSVRVKRQQQPNCVDGATNCPLFIAYCYSPQYLACMVTNCRNTCKFCTAQGGNQGGNQGVTPGGG